MSRLISMPIVISQPLREIKDRIDNFDDLSREITDLLLAMPSPIPLAGLSTYVWHNFTIEFDESEKLKVRGVLIRKAGSSSPEKLMLALSSEPFPTIITRKRSKQ